MNETQLPLQITEDEGDFGEIAQQVLRVAQKGRWWILLTGLGSLLLAVAGLSFVPNVYRSEATILVLEQQIPQNLVAPLSNAMGTQKLQAMTQEILSRSSLLKIINDSYLFADKKVTPDAAVGLFWKAYEIAPIGVTRDGSFNSFSISFSASTPERAQEVTRMLASLFIERHSEKQVNRANSTTGFLRERLTGKRERLSELEHQIGDFKGRHAGDLPENRMANETRMAELRIQLQNATANLSRAKQQRVILESMIDRSINKQITRLKTERTALLSGFTAKHPEVIKRDEDILQLEQMLANVKAGLPLPIDLPERVTSSNAAIGQLQGQIETNRLEVENLLQDQKRYEPMIGDLQRHLNSTPVLEQQMAGMLREAEGLNQEISKLDGMEQQSALSVDMEKRQKGEQFRLLDFPSLPMKPVRPARFKISAGASMGGFILGFVVAFLLDMRKPCFHTEQQIRKQFGPPMVLSIPELFSDQELRARKKRGRWERVAGSLVILTMLAVELYVYKFV